MTVRNKQPDKITVKVKSRTIPLKRNSIVVYRRPRGMDEEAFTKFLNQAAHDILARIGFSTIAVGVDHWNEIRVMDEAEMEKSGWVRKERVFLFKEQVDLSRFSSDEIAEILSNLSGDEEE